MNGLVKWKLEHSINQIEELYKYLESRHLLDEQETLNWLDKLNEISVRH